MADILIVGLGNPGKKYEKTRHNVGFAAIDEIAADFQFPPFNFQSISNSQISKGEINDQKIIMAKPQTFMNLSGQAVRDLIANYQSTINNLFVIHDDIDLPLGTIRVVKNRGAAGHKGIISIIKELKHKNFIRLRIGIKPKNGQQGITNKISTENLVLKKFNKEEKETIKKVVKKTPEVVEIFLKEGLEKTMSKFNN